MTTLTISGIDRSGPQSVLPHLLQYDALKNPGAWRWTNLAGLLGMFEEVNLGEDFVGIGNTSGEDSIWCVLDVGPLNEQGGEFKLAYCKTAALTEWLKKLYFIAYKPVVELPFPEVHGIYIPAGVAVNILHAKLGVGRPKQFLTNPGEPPEVLDSAPNTMSVVQLGQYKHPDIPGNLVNLLGLLGVKRAKSPLDAGMWEAGFDNRADCESLMLTGVVWVRRGPEPTIWELDRCDREAEGSWQPHTWTAESFRTMFAGKGFRCYVPAFWAARVLSNAPVVSTATDLFDPASPVTRHLVPDLDSCSSRRRR